MKAAPIGKGLHRIYVRSKAMRDRLALIPGVQISGARVIFPEWMYESITRIVHGKPKKKSPLPEQASLFDE